MIKRLLLTLTIILVFNAKALANINAIDLDKIHYKNEIKEDLDFVIENEHIFNHWSQNWTYEISKKDGLALLKRIQEISAKKAKTIEELLLTGMLSHYRYNLEDEKQFLVAESFFKKAIENNRNNYKPYWFLANHYANSGNSKDAVLNFLIAEKHNDKIKNPEFWQEYAFAFYLAGMTSHSLKGLNEAKILGKPSSYEKTIMTSIKEKRKKLDKNKDYEAQEIWDYRLNEKTADFTSKALGMKFSIDTTWTFNITKLSNKTSSITINPKSEKNSEGKKIDYSIMLMIHIPNENESIDKYSERFIKKYNDKIPNKTFDQFNPNLSFEIYDKKMYSDIGGAHIQFMAIEKSNPLNPGLELERAISFPKKKVEDSDTVEIYRLKSNYDRFDGKIQYILILDTCEDIYDKSFKVYSEFLKTLIIE